MIINIDFFSKIFSEFTISPRETNQFLIEFYDIFKFMKNENKPAFGKVFVQKRKHNDLLKS